MDYTITKYLKEGPPWLGDSSFDNRGAVKRLGARWKPEVKKWAAMDERMLLSLIEEGVWRPSGYDAAFSRALMNKIRRNEKVSGDMEMRRRALEAESFKTKPDKRDDDAVLRRELRVPEDEPENLAIALAHGMDSSKVRLTAKFRNLGPRSGISDAARLIRGVDLGVTTWPRVAKRASLVTKLEYRRVKGKV
jgi:hypothetical protein